MSRFLFCCYQSVRVPCSTPQDDLAEWFLASSFSVGNQVDNSRGSVAWKARAVQIVIVMDSFASVIFSLSLVIPKMAPRSLTYLEANLLETRAVRPRGKKKDQSIDSRDLGHEKFAGNASASVSSDLVGPRFLCFGESSNGIKALATSVDEDFYCEFAVSHAREVDVGCAVAFQAVSICNTRFSRDSASSSTSDNCTLCIKHARSAYSA